MAKLPDRSNRRERLAQTDWRALYARARTLVESGWKRVRENLSESEQRELLDLLHKFKGKPRNLSATQKRRLRELLQKAAIG